LLLRQGLQLAEKCVERLEGTLHLIAVDTVAGTFDVHNPAARQQFGHFFVLYPDVALGIGFEDQRRSSNLGKQLIHRRAAAAAPERGIRVM